MAIQYRAELIYQIVCRYCICNIFIAKLVNSIIDNG